ncbi:MAG: hypothetical protein J0H55_02360 [Chitinophagaceae bacterium]|nr:hypothetical protein [Chitinophagaceae bacterium]
MKKIYFIAAFLLCGNFLFAQMVKNPVSWTSSTRKTGDKTYEITLVANIGSGWHMYSQNTPDGGPLPTKITFSKNPLVILPSGHMKESGKLEQRFEPLFGVDVRQYSNQVEFKQTVKLKANVKTSVDVAVQFMTCNDRECLPPTTRKFTVALK